MKKAMKQWISTMLVFCMSFGVFAPNVNAQVQSQLESEAQSVSVPQEELSQEATSTEAEQAAKEDDVKATAEPKTGGTAYYVDSVNGNDEADGLTKDTPWKTLSKINALTLAPGDKVLLKAGSVFEQQALAPKGEGSEQEPIVIDMYSDDKVGTEAGTRPHIKAGGSASDTIDGKTVSYGLYIKNMSHIKVNNLEVSNFGATIKYSVGICVDAAAYGVMKNVHLNNVYVHDVDGDLQEKTVPNGGIYYVVTDPANNTRYDNISIQNCSVKNVSRTGISIGSSRSADAWDNHGGRIPQNVLDAYAHTNVVIRNNYVENAGGDAIVPMFSVKPLIEYNISKDASQNTKGNPGAMYNAGIWPWRCEDAVFQFNEVYGTVNNGDGQAYDCDWSRGTIYQYNYSHDNEGGFMLICLSEVLESVVRYNISQNDMRCLFLTSNTNNADIYNNTMYIGEGLNTNVVEDAGGVALLQNNIFYNAGSKKSPTWGRKYTYNNNLYFGFDTQPEDANKIVADPMFTDPGKGGTGVEGNSAIDTLSGYTLNAGSPAINAGVDIKNHGGRDYAGNEVGATALDIGALETQTPDVIVRSETYAVNHKTSIITLPDEDITAGALLSKLTYTDGAALSVELNGAALEAGALVTDDTVVKISKGDLSKTYTLKFNRVYPEAKVTSTVYLVDQLSGKIFIEAEVPFATFKENIIAENRVTVEYKTAEDIEVTSGNIGAGFKVVATSGSGSKIYTVQLITVKDTYDYVTDFMAGTQGPFWYNEYTQAGETKLFETWHVGWNCWLAMNDLLTAGVENSMGLIAPTRGGDAAFTWVAPKDGIVELNQKHLAYLRRDHLPTGNMGLYILRNGEKLYPASGDFLVQAQSKLFLRPITINVKKGDRIAFGTNFKNNIQDSSTYFTPSVSYVENGEPLVTDLTQKATITASSTQADFSVNGLKDNNISSVQKAREWKAAEIENQWINFAFDSEQTVSKLIFVKAANGELQSDVKLTFSNGETHAITAQQAAAGGEYTVITLPKQVKTSFVKMDFINATAAPVIGEIQILNQVSVSNLKKLYEDNKDRVQADYPPDNWPVFAAALSTAKALITNVEATQEEIDTAFEKLKNAAKAIEPSFNITVTNATASAEQAKEGDEITVTASETQDLQFVSWTAEGIVLTQEQKTQNPLKLIMPKKDIKITASLEEKPSPEAESMSITPEYLLIENGDEVTLLLQNEKNEKIRAAVWSSSNTNVATVVKGAVKTVGTGSCYIIADYTTPLGNKLTASVLVDVVEKESLTAPAANLEQKTVKSNINSANYADVRLNYYILTGLDKGAKSMQAANATANQLAFEPNYELVVLTQKDKAVIDDYFKFVMNKDNRSFKIQPTEKAKENIKALKSSYKVSLGLKIKGQADDKATPLRDVLTLSVDKTTPKVTAKAVKFNTFFTADVQALNLTSALGKVTDVRFAAAQPNLPNGKVNPDWVTLTADNTAFAVTKAPDSKSLKTAYLEVQVEGFTGWYPVTVGLSFAEAKPGVKLNTTSATISKEHPTPIAMQVLPSSTKQTLAQLNVTAISVEKSSKGVFTVQNFNAATGEFTLTASTMPEAAATVTLQLSIANAAKSIPLTVKVTPSASLALAPSKSSVSLNGTTPGADVAVITVKTTPVAANISGLTATVLDSKSKPINGAAQLNVAVAADGRSLTIATNSLTAVGSKYVVMLKAPDKYNGKDVTKAITVTTLLAAKAPVTASIGAVKLDSANPDASASFKVTAKNTNAGFKATDFKVFAATKQYGTVDASRWFVITQNADGSYRISFDENSYAEGLIRPEYAYTIKLAKDTEIGGAKLTKEASAKITVTQSAAKITQSTKSATMYKYNTGSTAKFSLSMFGEPLPQTAAVRIVGNPGNAYKLTALGNGEYMLSYNGVPPTAGSVKLSVWLKGNYVNPDMITSEKPNASVTISVALK